MNDMSINFLLQAIKILHIGNYDDTEIMAIYEYLINLDNVILNMYFRSYSVLQYNNDLEFCIEVMNKLIKVLESKEDYEKCQILLKKKEEALNIIKIKIDQYERI